jgi:hypothetical protein
MIVKTRNPIRTVNVNVKPNASFSYAVGDKIVNAVVNKIAKEEGGDDGDVAIEKGKPATGEQFFGTPPEDKKVKTGYFSKGKRTVRKDNRKEKRALRRANRKAKYGARPLNPLTEGGKQFYKDKLPKLRKKANGNFEKTLPDGTVVNVPKEEVTIIPPPANNKNAQPTAVETKDLKTPAAVTTQVVNGVVEVSKKYTEDQTEVALNDKGQEQVYKKADVVDADSKEAKKPMSLGLKIGIGVAATAVLGVIIYLMVRPRK